MTLPRDIDAILRELVNALGKATMYPAGHRFITESNASLVAQLGAAMTGRDALTIGILPRGLLIDGKPAEPLSAILREFAVRMHRKNIAAIQLRRGLEADEAALVLAALAASDAEEKVGRDGLQLTHARVDPMTYEALTLAGSAAARELDETFWITLTEAAYDQRASGGDPAPTIAQLADAISDRAAHDTEGARRVYETLSGFASALTGRGGRNADDGRHRFVELLSALSRTTTMRVVAAAPSAASRRRFLAETLELVPPTLLIRILESVAEVDGEAISSQLQALLGKLARADGDSAVGFPIQVLGLIQQWDEISDEVDEATDAYCGVDLVRVVAIGIEAAAPCDAVIAAARQLADDGRFAELFVMLDDAGNDPPTVATMRNAILDAALLGRLLAAPALDFAIVDRVAVLLGSAAVVPLLDALAEAAERATRRHLLDILMRIGPGSEAVLLARLEGAPWYLARNILAVLAQLPTVINVEPVLRALAGPDLRVRQEALKVLVRQPAARDRAIAQALASGEGSLVRMALAALGTECPKQLLPDVLAILDHADVEIQVLAIRVLAENPNPSIAPHLLSLVSTRRGIFRRVRLVPKSPAVLAALELLARRWARDSDVAPVLQLAAASHDTDLRAAVGGQP